MMSFEFAAQMRLKLAQLQDQHSWFKSHGAPQAMTAWTQAQKRVMTRPYADCICKESSDEN